MICKICNKEIKNNNVGRKRVICFSEKCKRQRKKLDNKKYKIIKDGFVGYKLKSCIICNKEFKPITSRQKTCSLNCRKIINNLKNNNFMKKKYKELKGQAKFELIRFIRNSIRKMIYNKKNKHSIKYIDYSIDQLKKHLESRFKEGMSWENHGVKGWHIDHIKPLYSFNFINDKGEINFNSVKEAMSLNNLQPLWAKENLRKGKKLEVKNDYKSA